jgi:hypothetical protein
MASTSFPSDLKDKFMLRLSDGMRDRVKELAASNHRSMNAEILAALETWLNESRVALDKGDFRQLLRQDAGGDDAKYGQDFPEVSIRYKGQVIDYVPHPKHLAQSGD